MLKCALELFHVEKRVVNICIGFGRVSAVRTVSQAMLKCALELFHVEKRVGWRAVLSTGVGASMAFVIGSLSGLSIY